MCTSIFHLVPYSLIYRYFEGEGFLEHYRDMWLHTASFGIPPYANAIGSYSEKRYYTLPLFILRDKHLI